MEIQKCSWWKYKNVFLKKSDVFSDGFLRILLRTDLQLSCFYVWLESETHATVVEYLSV